MDAIPSIFCSSVEKNKNRIVFNYFEDSWKAMTYGEFYALANNIASFLISNGIYKGDRIAIVSENRPEWCASYMAILMCGGIAIPIDMQLGSDEIKNLLVDSETKIIFYSSMTGANVLKAIEGIDIKGINLDTTPFTHSHIHSFVCSSASPDDIASIIYTSGTTGKPKGVMLTHKNFCSNADAVIQAKVVTHDDNVLSILPLHHTYPFMCTFLVPLFAGAAITFTPGLKAADLVSAIKDKNVTIVVAVPRLLEIIRDGIFLKIKGKKIFSRIILWMMKLCGIARMKFGINMGKAVFKSIHERFGKLKFFASGGARLEPSVMKDLEAIGFTVLEGYGLTETSPIVTFNPPDKRKIGSTGRPLFNVDIKIGDDGEIMVRGPMVMKGYYRNQTATADAIRDGWLLTGDTGYLDKDGYLFITGRKKEVIVLSSGKNVYPEDVEAFYTSIPLIKEICITELEGQLHAVVVPDFEYARKYLIGNISEALKWEINEVSMKLPEYMRIKGYTVYSGQLPRTALGKIKRFVIKDILKTEVKERERGEDKTLLKDEVSRRIVDCIKAVMTEPIMIQSSDNLELDLGFDSLKRIELISSLESAFSVSLPETFAAEVQTVDDIIIRLKELVSREGIRGGGLVSWKDILEKELLKEDREKIGFYYNKWELLITYIVRLIQVILFKLIFKLQVYGKEHIPDKCPFIIAPNHVSFLDGFVIASSVPYKTFNDLYFLGFQKYFTGRFRSWFAKIAHVIPIDPEIYLNKAMQMSAHVLKNKKALCIFPEGGRSFDGRLMEFKKGIGVLAVEMGISVVPVFIKGTFKALPRGAKFIRPSKINVTFGHPLNVSDINMQRRPDGVDEYQYFAQELRKRVIMLSENS
ncbi:AMP-binding protein [Dissulfurispira thermophila]|nr:AMP-binding protein [Dissulfurispira thermophila]